jgi:hypothetical protein
MATDKKETRSLFRRLTRLFKSGPVVRRKIKTFDTVVAVPDKIKSSGTLLFQKSLSPTYATITSNAYNLSERLMRYQDFQEMEYTPEIAAALDIYCLTGDSIISTPYGDFTILQLLELQSSDDKCSTLSQGCDNFPPGKFPVYCYDADKKSITIGKAHSVRKTGTQVPVVKVTLDDGQFIRCTPNHRFMLRDGSYVHAYDLKPGVSLMPFTIREMGREGHEYPYVYTMDKTKTKSGWRAQHLFNVENLVRQLESGEVVHHKDFDRRNNKVSNLEIMSEFDHSSLHAKINNKNKLGKTNEKHSQWMLENNPVKIQIPSEQDLTSCQHMLLNDVSAKFETTYSVVQEWVRKLGYKNWTAFKLGEKTSIKQTMSRGTSSLTLDEIKKIYTLGETKAQLVMKLGCTVNVFDKFLNRKLKTSWSALVESLGSISRSGGRPAGSFTSKVNYQDICNVVTPGVYQTQEQLASKLGVSQSVIIHRMKLEGFDTFSSWVESYHNHKVVSIEQDGLDDVYDLTTDEHHNFACNGVIVHNSDETCSQDDKGRVLHVYSDNEKVKEVLEDLFYNILNVEFNLRSWARNLPVQKDTIIPLLDGRNVTIEQLASEHASGKQNWVYSIHESTHKAVPGKVKWCGKTRENSQIVRVWLDDQTYVDTSPDHEWVLRDGSRLRADQLTEGTSLMPFYREISTKNSSDNIIGYEKVYDPASGEYKFTHRIVADDMIERLETNEKQVVHHVDLNKRNNSPENLKMMTWTDHSELHQKIYYELCAPILKRPDVIAKKKASLQRFAKSEAGKQSYVERGQKRQDYLRGEEFRSALRVKFDDRCLDHVMNVVEKLNSGRYVGTQALCNALKNDDDFLKLVKEANPWSKRDLSKVTNKGTIASLISRAAGAPYHVELARRFPDSIVDPGYSRARVAYEKGQKKNRLSNGVMTTDCTINHKVVRVENLDETSDVYCMEVRGDHGEHDRHNFMVMSKDQNGEVSNSGVCVSNCKYGDFFLFNDVSPEYGVVNAFPVPVNEIEREENYDRDDPFAIRYRWVTLGNRTLENWEITHFRLLGNDMFLPYGSSIIEPARRIWRQLILIEDAMLVYRVVRAPERRVFYIDVANVPPENVPMYVEEQRKNLRTNQVVDQATGRVDLRYNPLPIHKDTPVPLLDGSTLTIENLSKKMNEEPGWIPWVYSVQDGTQKIVPGKVVWCGKNYTANSLTKVWLDDGSYVLTAPEHPYVMRDGSSKRADELMSGDSLMSAYRDLSNKGYERIVEPNGELNSTHVIVARDAHQSKWNSTEGRVVHHKHPENGVSNKRDNRPENLEVMNFWEHRKMHAEHCELTLNRPEQLEERRIKRVAFNKSPEKRQRTADLNRELGKAQKMGENYNGSVLHASHNEIRSAAQKKSWSVDKEARSEKMKWIIPNDVVSFLFNEIKLNQSIGREELTHIVRNDVKMMDLLCHANDSNERDINKFHISAVVSKIHRMGCIDKTSFREFRKFALTHEAPVNHQVIKVESIAANDDVYCMTVMGTCGEDDRHNFAVNSLGQTIDANCLKSLIFVLNSVDEDYFIPVRGADSGTRIDTLAGGQNTGTVEDVAYIQKKLFAALKIPRAYLGYDEMLCLVSTTCVPLCNGVMTTMGELAKRFDGEQDCNNVWVYSCDPLTGEFKPGRVKNAWKTKDVKELYRITLDNDHIIECTDNHPFMCRDGSYKRADELISGQSLMPMYRKLSSSKKNGGSDHKVINVEVIKLDEPIPVYDLTIEGFHNFVITPSGQENWESGIVVHNSSKATLAQEDIRFSRTIGVIQKTIIAELNKLSIIHLYAHGFDNDDLMNFTLRLSNPSTVAQQQKLELWRAKFEIAGSAPEGMASKEFIRHEIWGLNEQEISKIDDQRIAEKIIDAKIEATTGEGEGEEGGGGGGGGGGEDLFGGGETPAETPETEEPAETPPPETAGEEPAEEKEPGLELLTSSDDATESDKPLKFSLKKGETPVKPKSQMQKNNYNASRRRHHGASSTHMPNFQKMTSTDSRSMQDPYDNDFLKSIVSNPMGESRDTMSRLKLSTDVVSMLGRMHLALEMDKFPAHESSGLLKEGIDVQDEIDDKNVIDEGQENNELLMIDVGDDDDDNSEDDE